MHHFALSGLVGLVWLLAAPAALAQPLTVSAASSLADVMTEVGRAWAMAGGPGIQVNAAGSNVLARQVAQGARVDVFVSADHAQMDIAVASGRLVAGSVRDLLSNTLVVVVPGRAVARSFAPADLAGSGVRRLALGNPQSVPAGVYARQWLERAGLWSAVAPKVIPTLTVRSALAAVRAARVDAGVVFDTDARSAPDVTVAYRVPVSAAPPIRYPVAIVQGPREADASRFVQFLTSDVARAIFEAAGFTMAGG
jgi:molybdate transport system substrate-binding protein